MNRFQKNILILEPDEGLRESLKLILENDFNFFSTNNIEKALEFPKPSLFIFDVDSFQNSLEIVKQIKSKYPELTILLLSINFELSFQENAIRIGTGIRFQEKPFEAKDLLERVHTLIRGYSLKRHRHIIRIKNV